MVKIDKAVVLAAGRGTRMRELTADLPKPMIEVRGKPVLQHIVEGLRDAGIRAILLIVGYRADTVRNFLRRRFPLQYRHSICDADGTRWDRSRSQSCPRLRQRYSVHFELRRHFGRSGKLQTHCRSSG